MYVCTDILKYIYIILDALTYKLVPNMTKHLNSLIYRVLRAELTVTFTAQLHLFQHF